jgi:mannose-1-phosphate guanylyltransferase/phosphomannomutase
MMEAATSKSAQFVGGNKGGFIFPDFFFATDAMYSFAKIMEMMALCGKRLGEIDAALPRMVTSRRNVNCSWEHKGKVMRNIMRDSEGKQRDLVDGVKVHLDQNGATASVLLLPDKERPLFHINAEAMDKATADHLANQYERKVIQWRDQP